METITEKYDLDLSGFEDGLGKIIAGYDEINAKTKATAQQNPFRKQADDLLKVNTQLRAGGPLVQHLVQGEKNLQAEIKRLAAEYVRAATAQQKANTPLDLKKSQTEIKKLRSEIDALTKQIDKANDQLDKLSKKRKTDGNKGGGMLGKIDVGGTVGQLASGAGLALGGAEIIRKAVTDSAEYGRKLSELSALTGAAGKDLAFLDQQAQAIEQDTGVVASTILDTFKAVGSIQPELLSNKQALADTTKEVVALAQAGSITLPEAAQATLGALNQFGEGAGQASRFVNVLAAGALKGASEIADTTQALQDSGTAMKAAGLSFEQGNALIQSLAGVMIKGSEAGTGLRNVLVKLETASDKNLRPSVVGLDQALENASKKYDTTTELTKVFGVENILVARRVLDTRNEIAGLTKELTGTDVAYQQQRVNLDNLATDLDKAGSATTGFFRTLGQSQDGLLRRLTQGYTLFLQNIANAKSTARTFLDSYISNDSDGLIGALFTAGKDASRQSDANEVIRKRNAEIAGITNAAQQQVAGETQDLVALYTKQGEELPKAQRKAADAIKKQKDQQYQEAVANHARLKKELEQEVSMTGKDSGQMNDRFAESRKRILATQTAKAKADSEVARLDSSGLTRANALKSLQGEAPSEDQKKALSLAQKNRDSLIEGRKKMEEELQALQDNYDKQQLEKLDKNSTEYLQLKQKFDLREIDQLRQHLIEEGQVRTGYEAIDTKTGATIKVKNMGYQLPKDKEDLLNQMRDQARPDIYANNTKKLTDLINSDLTEKLEKDELARAKKYGDMELELRNKLVDETGKLTRQAGESEVDYERRKAETLLQIKLDYYNKVLELARKDPSTDPATLTGFREAVQETQSQLDGIKKQGKSGPGNIFDLLGITFYDDAGKPLTDEAMKVVAEVGTQAISTAQNVLAQQVESDQARISSIDALLQAKQNEVQVEATLAAAGLANNLASKRQEQQQLQVERAKAIEAQRRDQAIQIALNTVLQESQLALALAKIISNAASFGPLFPFIVGAEIASMFAVLAGGITQIAALPKYHTGDEVTPDTARSRVISGARQPDEVDARLQVGEGVIQKKSYQANKRLFRYLNTIERPMQLHDLAAYVRDNPFEMVGESRQQGLRQINQYYELKGESLKPDGEVHRRLDETNSRLDTLISETRKGNRVSRTALPDGRIKEVDEYGNVTIIRHT